MYKGHRVAVVMPIYNEAGLVRRAVSRVPAFVDLIIAVDDGSIDGTWAELSQITGGRVVKLRHEKNRGVGAATKTGYHYSLQTDAELIAVMDGDGQMDGRDLPRLLDLALGGVDYVKGNRFLHRHTISRMPFTRYVGNRVLSLLTRAAASFNGHLDAQCGYTVIRRAALKLVDLDRLYDRYGFPNEIFFAVCGKGLTVRSAPVMTIYGDEVSGINPLTAVPIIMCLIGRSYLRRKLQLEPALSLLAVRDHEITSSK